MKTEKGRTINTALVQVRVDKALKDEVTDIYNHYGPDLPTAIRIFMKKTENFVRLIKTGGT